MWFCGLCVCACVYVVWCVCVVVVVVVAVVVGKSTAEPREQIIRKASATRSVSVAMCVNVTGS